MNRGFVVLLVSFALLLCWCPAQARDETLSFQRAMSGHVEAVVSGSYDGPGCAPEFVSPTSVDVNGAVVTIASPYAEEFCYISWPPVPYRVVADLGVLTGDRYDVTWKQGPLSVAGALVPAEINGGGTPIPAPTPVPTLSLLGMLTLLLSTVAVAALSVRRIVRREGRRYVV